MSELSTSRHPYGWNNNGGNYVTSDHLVPRFLSGGPCKDGHFISCSDATSWFELSNGLAGSQQNHANDEQAGGGLPLAGKGADTGLIQSLSKGWAVACA